MPTTFEPVTLDDLKSTVSRLLPGGLEAASARLTGQPCRNTLYFVGLTSLLFFIAERGRNPRVNTIFDATLYCSTCLSVGYADIHPVTPAGKALGTLLMTFGPSLVSKVADGPKDQSPDLQPEILATLRQILAKLEAPQVA
jgi:hypothetical protein